MPANLNYSKASFLGAEYGFMKKVAELSPDIFLIENVPQMLTSYQGQEMLNEAYDLGYYLAQPSTAWHKTLSGICGPNCQFAPDNLTNCPPKTRK